MNCRSCNTRIPEGAATCPHCGHSEKSQHFIDRPEDGAEDPQEEAVQPLDSLTPVDTADEEGESGSGLASCAGDDADFELEQEVELPLESAVGPYAIKPPPPDPVGPPKSASRRTPRTSDSPVVAAPAATSAVRMDPAQLGRLIIDQPELLEPGLSAYADDTGREVGVGFATAIGEIDLLAESTDGALVVVMIAPRELGKETIPDMLNRIGWVRKHLVKGERIVRGILIVERIDESLGYTAAAVGDTIEFRTCRISLSFEPVEI